MGVEGGIRSLGRKVSSVKEKATQKITHTKCLKTKRELEAIYLCLNTYGIPLDHKCLSKTLYARKLSSKYGRMKNLFFQRKEQF